MTEIFISPTFDPSDNTWYTDDGIEAKSLAELQAMMPDVKIIAYYPEGYGNVVHPRAPHVVKSVSQHAKPRFKPEIEEELSKPVELPRFLLSRKEPSEDEPEPPEPDYKPVVLKRTRAPSQFNRVDWHDSRNVDLLRQLVTAKLKSPEIAKRFKCTRNAIIGACHRLGFQLQGKGIKNSKRTPGE